MLYQGNRRFQGHVLHVGAWLQEWSRRTPDKADAGFDEPPVELLHRP